MKIMTYNILDGGIDKNGSRVEKIIDVIKSEAPDFLALQETDDFERNDFELSKKMCEKFELPYYALSSGERVDGGNPYHVATFSRYPLLKINTFPRMIFGGAALSTVIETPLGELSFCNIHLNAYSKDKRMKEITTILEYQSKFKKQIILGDHNALSRSDKYADSATQEFMRYDFLGFEVTDMLKKNYVDVALCLKGNDMRTHPTSGIGTSTPIRIDYMFVTPTLTSHVKTLTEIITPTSKVASDHYPITLILE